MATECLDMFHGIDRTAFKTLTQVFHREATQSLMVILFFLSLESMRMSGIMQNATNKDSWFMNSLAEDCVICLKCLLSLVLSGVVEKSEKLETLGYALRTEVIVSQIHGMRSILLTIIPDTLSNMNSRIFGDLNMDAGWLDYQRNPARVLGYNPQDEGRSVVPKVLDDEERPKTLTVCFGRESMPIAEAIADFFSNLFGQVVRRVTVMPRRDKDSGDFAFVLFNDASIPRIIMGTKMLFIIPYKG
ncbi:uncharacterized protein [Arachis hypogaea]|uniref:uncharacterized protein n=1 Tax=Arachis hypogaea TaxID=3818 RepID=UPI003B21E782